MRNFCDAIFALLPSCDLYVVRDSPGCNTLVCFDHLGIWDKPKPINELSKRIPAQVWPWMGSSE